MRFLSTFFLKCAVVAAAVVIVAICGGAVYLLAADNPLSQHFYLLVILLVGVVCASVPCMLALAEGYRILNLIDSGLAFSDVAATALRKIVYCAFAVFVINGLGGLPFFIIVAKLESFSSLVLLGAVLVAVSFVIAVFASVLHRLLTEAIELKKEAELVV